jgi:5-methylcytosine-specific restriction endonuclease McrA
MNALVPSSLSPEALARRLAELVASEREALVEFLLHLEEFDRRRLWAEAGYDSLWNYCQRVLHLREGPAARRIGAMRIVRQFPPLADAIRDGRLCLSTVTLLTPLLTEQSLDDVLARAAYKTKAEVEHLVASALPREAPREGIRRLPERRVNGEGAPANVAVAEAPRPATELDPSRPDLAAPPPSALAALPPPPVDSSVVAPASCAAPPAEANRVSSRATVMPVSAEQFSLRVTIDAALKSELEALTALLSHKVPNGDLAAVLQEAIHCALEKHGRRKGAVPPQRERTRAPDAMKAMPSRSRGSSRRSHVPADVRREVWKRDRGRCTWCGPDGHRCESRWQLEFDHVTPVALGDGGTPTAKDLRLRCRVHNQLYAEQVFGAELMARFRRRDGPKPVRFLIPG